MCSHAQSSHMQAAAPTFLSPCHSLLLKILAAPCIRGVIPLHYSGTTVKRTKPLYVERNITY